MDFNISAYVILTKGAAKLTYSFVIPRVGATHFCGFFRYLGKTKIHGRSTIIHYFKSKCIGKTIRNPFGEPNHYNTLNQAVGYSRNISRTKIIHYNAAGNPIGYSRCLLFLRIHYGPITRMKFFTPIQANNPPSAGRQRNRLSYR